MPLSSPKHLARAMVLLALLLLTGCLSGSRQPPRPNGVAVAPDGSIYVMDLGNHRVAHLSPDGRLRGAFGKLGIRPDEIYEGWGMALDQAGNIYFCDRRIKAFHAATSSMWNSGEG